MVREVSLRGTGCPFSVCDTRGVLSELECERQGWRGVESWLHCGHHRRQGATLVTSRWQPEVLSTLFRREQSQGLAPSERQPGWTPGPQPPYLGTSCEPWQGPCAQPLWVTRPRHHGWLPRN